MPALAFKIRTLRSAGRRGITLIELLVVMVILSIVTAATIPLLSTGADQRRLREAVRRALPLLTVPADVVLHPRTAVLTLPFAAIEQDVAEIFRTIQKRCAPAPPSK